MVAAEPELGRSLAGLYAAALSRLGTDVPAAVSRLAAPSSLPALVHCTAGKDGTGLLIALVLSTLGVADDVVAAVDPPHVFEDDQVDLTPLHRADASAMLETLAVVRDLAGSAREYLVGHGVSPDGLDRLAAELVVARP